MKTAESKSSASRIHNSEKSPSFFKEHGDATFFSAVQSKEEPFFQAKLNIHPADDPYEREADAVADRVVNDQSFFGVGNITSLGGSNPPTQTKPAFESPSEMDVQSKEIQKAPENDPKPEGPSGDFESKLHSSKGGGAPMDDDTRSGMESSMGADFSNVRVHTGAEAAQMSQNIGAQAFTHGSDIYFNEGKYNPGSRDGKHLLAHELTHTVQQGGAVQRKPLDTISRIPTALQASFIRELIDDLVDLADMAGISIPRIVDNIPGYTLFSYIVEYDIIRGRSVERNAHSLIRGLMGLIPGGEVLYQKLNEYGILDKAFEWVTNKLSSLNLSLGRIEDTISNAWDDMGISLGVSGNLAVLDRHFTPLFNDVKTFASDSVDALIELVKEALIRPLVEYLDANSPAYKLATKVIGQKFPLEDEVNAPTVEILEEFLILIGKETEVEQMKEKGTLQETADWIDTQLGRFFSLLGRFQALVKRVWDAFTLETLSDIPGVFSGIWEEATELFQDLLDFALEVAAKVLEIVKNALLGWLSSFANDIPGFHLLTVIIERNPFTGDIVERTTENIIRGFMGLVPGGEAKFQELKESGVVPRAAKRIDQLIETLGISLQFIIDLFMGVWNSLSIEDLIDPLGAFQRIADQYGEPISRLFTFVVEVVKIIVELILAMMNFPSDLIGQIIANVMKAFEKIKNDPVEFLMNLLRAVKKGFEQFFTNFIDHLLGGLQTWLFGELGEAGITPPEDISFRSILGMSLEVLGITVDNILDRLALKIGEERVEQIRAVIDTLTGIWTFIKDVMERGPIAIWEYIQEKISNLWDIIVDGIKGWIMEKIITRVTAKLLSLLDPTGIMPVINSFIAFFNAVQSFIEKLREILEIINTFVLGIIDIANGNIATAANFLEQALSDGVPVAISFLAKQVGLGNLGEKIAEMIELARAKINEGIDWLLDKALAAGTAFLNMLGLGGEQENEEGELSEEENPTGLPTKEVVMPDGSVHTLYFEQSNGEPVLFMRSVPTNVMGFLGDRRRQFSSPDMIDRTQEGIDAALRVEDQADQFNDDPNYDPANLERTLENVAAVMHDVYLTGIQGAPTGELSSPYWIQWHKPFTANYPPIRIRVSPGEDYSTIGPLQRTNVQVEFFTNESEARTLLRTATRGFENAYNELIRMEERIDEVIANRSELTEEQQMTAFINYTENELHAIETERDSINRMLELYHGVRSNTITSFSLSSFRRNARNTRNRLTTRRRQAIALREQFMDYIDGNFHQNYDNAAQEYDDALEQVEQLLSVIETRNYTFGISPLYVVHDNAIVGPTTQPGRNDAIKDEMRTTVLPAVGLDPSAEGLEVDHAVDQFFGGPDAYENLWPIPSAMNPIPPRLIHAATGKEAGKFPESPEGEQNIDLNRERGKHVVVKGSRHS